MSFFILTSQMQQADRLSIPIFMRRDMSDVYFFQNIHIFTLKTKEVIYKPESTQHFWFHWVFLSYSQTLYSW